MSIYFVFPIVPIVIALCYRRVGKIGAFFVWAVATVFLFGLMPLGSRDFNNYLRQFDEIKSLQIIEVIEVEPLYKSMVWVAGYVGIPSSLFYISLGSLALAVKLIALLRLTDRQTLPIALYMCSFFYLHEFTQVRAALAIGLWMLGLSELPRSRSRYLIWTLLGTSVHFQAALGLLLYPLIGILNSRRRTQIFALAALSILIFSLFGMVDFFVVKIVNSIPDPRVAIYYQLAMESVLPPNPLSVMSMLAITTALVGLLPKARVVAKLPSHRRIDSYVFTSLLLGSLSLAALTSIPVAAFRISEHFFSLLPVGLHLATKNISSSRWMRSILWIIAGIFLYIFLFHSPYLLDPITGEHSRDNI